MAKGFLAIRVGRLIVTWCNQGHGAPFIDRCGGRCANGTTAGRGYSGRAILLTPWRRDRYGDSQSQPALVVGWLHAAGVAAEGHTDG